LDTFLIANDGSLDNQWFNCDNMGNVGAFTGVAGDSFKLNFDGYYTLVAGNGFCADTADCFQYISTGWEDPLDESAFHIFPNPGDGLFHLQCSGPDCPPQLLQIYSAQGKLVYQSYWNGTKEQIDLSHLPNGLYLLKVDGETLTQRVMLMR